MKESRDEYRRSRLDKYGPEGAFFYKIAVFVSLPVFVGAAVGAAICGRRGYSAGAIVVGAILGAIVGGVGSVCLIYGMAQGTAGLFRASIQPSGDHTPYARQYSREDALVIRGDVEGALESYEEIILESPEDAQPRIRAAERGRVRPSVPGTFSLYGSQ